MRKSLVVLLLFLLSCPLETVVAITPFRELTTPPVCLPASLSETLSLPATVSARMPLAASSAAIRARRGMAASDISRLITELRQILQIPGAGFVGVLMASPDPDMQHIRAAIQQSGRVCLRMFDHQVSAEQLKGCKGIIVLGDAPEVQRIASAAKISSAARLSLPMNLPSLKIALESPEVWSTGSTINAPELERQLHLSPEVGLVQDFATHRAKGQRLLYVQTEHALLILDESSLSVLHQLPFANTETTSKKKADVVVGMRTDEWLGYAMRNGMVRVQKSGSQRSSAATLEWPAHDEQVTAMGLTSDEGCLLTAAGSEVRVWNLKKIARRSESDLRLSSFEFETLNRRVNDIIGGHRTMQQVDLDHGFVSGDHARIFVWSLVRAMVLDHAGVQERMKNIFRVLRAVIIAKSNTVHIESQGASLTVVEFVIVRLAAAILGPNMIGARVRNDHFSGGLQRLPIASLDIQQKHAMDFLTKVFHKMNHDSLLQVWDRLPVVVRIGSHSASVVGQLERLLIEEFDQRALAAQA